MKIKTNKTVILLLFCVISLCLPSCEFTNTDRMEWSSGGFESIEQNPLYEDRAIEILSDMTVDEKIGQMFLVRCYPEKAEEDIKKYNLGGLILFASDFDKSVDEAVSDIERYKNASKYGLIVAVDEEGGSVVRVSKFKQYRSSRFLSPQQLYARGGFPLVHNDAEEKAKFLLSLGINVNLAPVCDVPTSSWSFIYNRSFGTDAQKTAEFVKIVVQQSRKEGLGSVLKHFPGYGDNGDTHIGYSYDERDMSVFRERDFLPFIWGIKAGADAVMVSHNIVTCMDSKIPASLSKAVHDVLRDELEFDGVIMTDDLSMDAIKNHFSVDKVALRAVLAGNDIICTSDYEELIPVVKNAVNNGTISTDTIDEAVLRVLRWKLKIGAIS